MQLSVAFEAHDCIQHLRATASCICRKENQLAYDRVDQEKEIKIIVKWQEN